MDLHRGFTEMSFVLRLLVMVNLLLAAGCWSRGVPKIPLTEAGRKVEAKMTDAPQGYVEIGPVFGQHGGDCTPGSRDQAINDLRNNAAAIGAQYVRMDSFLVPDSALECRHQEYIIRGVAFRREF